MLTETHLHRDHLDTEIGIDNYTVYRRERQNRSNGGVANYVHDDLATSTEILETFSNGITKLLICT